MKYINRYFSSNAWTDLGGGTEAKMHLFFQNMVMMHIKFKGMTHAATL